MIDFVKKITLQEKKLKRKETSSIKSYDHKPFMFLWRFKKKKIS